MQNVLRSFVIPVTPIIFGPASEFGSTWLRHHWNMICTDLHQSCDDFVGTKRLRFLASPWSFATPSITLMAASCCRMLTSWKNWPYQRQPMIDICGWSWLYYLIQKKWMANFPPHLVSDLDRLMNFVDLNTQGSNLIKQLLSMSILLDLETEWNRMKLMATDGLDCHLHGHRDPSQKPQNYGHWQELVRKKHQETHLDDLGFTWSRGRYFASSESSTSKALVKSCDYLNLILLRLFREHRTEIRHISHSHSNWNSAHTHIYIYCIYIYIRWRDLMKFRTWRKRLRTQLQANSASHGRHHQQHDTNRMDWIWINDGLDLSKMLHDAAISAFSCQLFSNCYARTASFTWVEIGTLQIGSYQIISIYIISIYHQFDKNGGCMDRLKNITYHPVPACSSLDSSIDTAVLWMIPTGSVTKSSKRTRNTLL